MTDPLDSLGAAAGDLLERGDPAGALPLYLQAVALASAAGRREELSGLLGDMAVAYRRLGDLSQAIETNRRAIEVARACQHDLNLARWSGNLGGLLYHHDDFDGAEAAFREAMDAAARTGLPEQISIAAGHLAAMMGERGRFSEAVEIMARARAPEAAPAVVAIVREQEIGLFWRWASALREGGRVREAREVIERALTTRAGAERVPQEVALLVLLAEIAENEGDMVSAGETMERAAAASEAMGDRRQADRLRDLARRMAG
jgi:tetratricopeptide (TPR) repeat protein